MKESALLERPVEQSWPETALSQDKESEKLHKLRRIVFTYLEAEGVVTKLEDGRFVVDTKGIGTSLNKKLRQNSQVGTKYADVLMREGNLVASTLATVFEDIPVVSREEYEHEVQTGKPATPRPLIYAPLTSKEALNVTSIKSSTFHLAPWEFGKIYDSDSPFVQPDQEGGANFFESSVAVLIFHPKFGNGHRDERGKLVVWWPSHNKFEPIAADWFREFRSFGSSRTGDSAVANVSPVRFITRFAPQLFRSGLVKISDFQVSAGSKAYESSRLRKPLDRSKMGAVMIDGIRYFIGKGEEFEGAEVIQLMPGVAGVITRDPLSGHPTLTHTFQLLDRNTPGLTADQSGKNTYYYAGKNLTNLQEFKPEEYISRRPQENDDQYQLRIKRSIQDISFLLSFSGRISAETGVNIAQLGFAEQNIIADSVRSIGQKPERILGFTKQFGLKGLRTFLSLEQDKSLGSLILELGERNEQVAQALFEKYGEVLDVAMSVRERVKEYFSNERQLTENELDGITYALTKKANDILERFARTDASNADKVMQQLQGIQSNILLFAASFKIANEDHALQFEDINGAELETKDAAELSEEEREEMLQIFLDNRVSGHPELHPNIVNGFERATRTPGKRFTLLRLHKEIISYIRFDDLPNGNLYAGSFNVRLEVRGSAIGSAMLRATLEREGETKDIEAVAYSKNPMLKHYTDDFGFKIAGEIPSYEGTGELWYKLFRPKHSMLRNAA